MKTLPDPRRYSRSEAPRRSRLMTLLDESPAAQHGSTAAVGQEIVRLLAEDRENEIRSAAGGALRPAGSRLLLEALDSALTPPLVPGSVQTRLFAIPVLLVTGGSAGTVVPCVLPDLEEVTRLFETTGALGQTRNFGLSNALISAASLEALPWRTLYRIAQGDGPGGVAGLELPPADVCLRSADEQLDLRFLAGAAVGPADTASFQESAGDIGRWGMKFTEAVSRQLSAHGATVLAIPRPPMSLIRAMQTGRFAHAELGFQLFMSNALRGTRMRLGDPEVTVAAHADASIRVRLTSPFDESFAEEYRWPLSPADDLADVAGSIFGLLAEVRLERVTVLDTVIDIDEKN
jgi:hypothetical protein